MKVDMNGFRHQAESLSRSVEKADLDEDLKSDLIAFLDFCSLFYEGDEKEEGE